MRILKLTKWVVAILFFIVLISNMWIIMTTENRVYVDASDLAGADVALVFGTSDKLIGGGANPFFKNRVLAAAELLNSGKVNKLLLSGSKDSVYYDEAIKMKKALLKMGIAEKSIILDQYGNRTLLSIARLRDVYNIDRCVFVTQKYHAYRTLFIADELGVSAECYIAQTPDLYTHKKAIIRELFARTKAIIDIYVLFPEKAER